MSNLVDAIRSKPSFYGETGASSLQIEQAEKALCLSFAHEFKEYLQLFGAASYGGHELTGFSADNGLDVVTVTQKNRGKHNVEKNLYVIEETHIDGIVVWQDSEGTIYQSVPGSKPNKIANSLYEYVSLSNPGD